VNQSDGLTSAEIQQNQPKHIYLQHPFKQENKQQFNTVLDKIELHN